MAEDIERVTREQIDSLRRNFNEKVRDGNPDFCEVDLERVKNDDLWMKRFIAAQEQDVGEACKMLYKTCEWRKEFGVNDLDHNKLMPAMIAKGALFIRNKDNWGKVLLIFKAKQHTKGVEDFEEIKKFIVYFFERIERVSKSDQISVIFDMKDTGWSNMDMDFIRYLITLLKEYYPYFVNYLMIFEMPWLLKSAWNIIKGWLPAKFVDRVKFVDKKTINEFINLENCLEEWGGKDKYTYSFEPEVREASNPRRNITLSAEQIERITKTSSSISTTSQSLQISNGNLRKNGPTVPIRSKSHKITFADRDGTRDIHDIDIDDDEGSFSHDLSIENRRRASRPVSSIPDPEHSPRLENLRNSQQQTILINTDDAVRFEPSDNLLSCALMVKNVSANNDLVMIKIKTTSPSNFLVRPTIGLIGPNQTSRVLITTVPGISLRSVTRDRFQIQAAVLPRELNTLSGSEESDTHEHDYVALNRLWKSITGNDEYMQNIRLPCILSPESLSLMTKDHPAPLLSPHSSNNSPPITMNGDEIKKGLKELENNISMKVATMYEGQNKKIIYGLIIIGLLVLFFGILNYSRLPSANAVEPVPNPGSSSISQVIDTIKSSVVIPTIEERRKLASCIQS